MWSKPLPKTVLLPGTKGHGGGGGYLGDGGNSALKVLLHVVVALKVAQYILLYENLPQFRYLSSTGSAYPHQAFKRSRCVSIDYFFNVLIGRRVDIVGLTRWLARNSQSRVTK